MEIVVYLMNQLNDRQGTMVSIDEMSADLRSMGFTDNEISSAYSWLLKHFEDYPHSFAIKGKEIGKRSVRILSETERKIISPQAYGYLLQLRHLGLLTAEQMEMILDRCMLFGGGPVDTEEMKVLASTAMFDLGTPELPLAVWIGDPESEPIN